MKRMLSHEEQVEIAICYIAGHPMKNICEAYDISRSGVHRVITRMGVGADRGKRSK